MARWLAFCCALPLAAGCARGPGPTYPPLARPAPPAVLSPRHAELARLGDDAIARAPGIVGRTSYSRSAREQHLQDCASVLRRLGAAARATGEYSYSPYPADEAGPDLRGMLALRRLAEWSGEAAVATGEWGTALERAATLLRLGEFLRGGDAAAAIAGLQAESAGIALATRTLRRGPRSLAADALRMLAEGEPTPRLGRALANEAEQALSTLEHARRLAASEQWPALEALVGPLSASRLAAFQALPLDAREQELQALAAQVSAYADWLAEAAERPVVERGDPPPRKPLACSALWPHATRGLDALVRLNDRVLAERRALGLLAWAIPLPALPRSLGSAPRSFAEDPYTGSPMGLRAGASGPEPYSSGENLRDDGGDPAFDVVLPPG